MAFDAGDLLTTSPGAWTGTYALVTDGSDNVLLDENDEIITDETATGQESIAYLWEIADDDSGTNATEVGTSRQFQTLVSHSNKYVRSSITLNNGFESTTASSDWESLSITYWEEETITVSPGTWTDLGDIDNIGGIPDLDVDDQVTVSGGSPPSGTESISWQWYRFDDGSGTNPVLIVGATSRQYTLMAADVGKYVACDVTLDNGADSTTQRSNYIGAVLSLGPSTPVITPSSTTVNFAENGTGTVLTYTITGNPTPTVTLTGPDAPLFTDTSGTITFASAPDYENPLDADGNNVYTFNIVGTNSEGSDSATITVTVTDLPVFTTPTQGQNFNVAENSTSTIFTAAVSGGGATFALSGADASLFTESSGAVSFTSGPNYEVPGDADEDNVYELTVTADVGGEQNSVDCTVTVTNVIEVPVIANPDDSEEISFPAGSGSVVVQATVANESSATTWSLTGTDAASADIDSNGNLTLNAIPSVGDGPFELNVVATNAAGSDSNAITIVIVASGATDSFATGFAYSPATAFAAGFTSSGDGS